MTARVPLQAHLDLTPPRTRVTLVPPDPRRREGKEPVLDVVRRREVLAALAPAAVAVAASAVDVTAVQALNKAAARALGSDGTDLTIDVEAFLGYTAWFTEPAPWCSGFYEVRQKSARSQSDFLRMWFDADRKEWRVAEAKAWTPPEEGTLRRTWLYRYEPIPHFNFTLSHFWRGLRAPWPAYTYKVPGRRVLLKDYPPITVGHHRV